jgi:hypothetical protein
MKVRLKEGQFERLKSVINEGENDKYNQVVKLDMHYYGSNFKGYEINDINQLNVRLFYDIQIEGRSWGIDGITVTSITGPSEVDIEIEYYVGDGEDAETETIIAPLKIDWSKANVYNSKGDTITIDDWVTVELTNDSEGNLLVKAIEITAYGL